MNGADTMTGEPSAMDLPGAAARILGANRAALEADPSPPAAVPACSDARPQLAGPLEVSVFTLPFSLPRRRWQRIPAHLAMLIPTGLLP